MGCLHNPRFVPNFLRIIWTCPIHHVPLSAYWKIEVGVLFLDSLHLLRFLVVFTVEEIMVDFLDTYPHTQQLVYKCINTQPSTTIWIPLTNMLKWSHIHYDHNITPRHTQGHETIKKITQNSAFNRSPWIQDTSIIQLNTTNKIK